MLTINNIKVKVDSNLKHTVENIFKEQGLSISEAITLFYKYVEINKELPFSYTKKH